MHCKNIEQVKPEHFVNVCFKIIVNSVSNNAQSPVLILLNKVFLLLNALEYLSLNVNKQLTAHIRMTKEHNQRRFVFCKSINLNKNYILYNYFRKSTENYALAIKWPWYKQLMITVLLQRWIISKVILIFTYFHDFLYYCLRRCHGITFPYVLHYTLTLQYFEIQTMRCMFNAFEE